MATICDGISLIFKLFWFLSLGLLLFPILFSSIAEKIAWKGFRIKISLTIFAVSCITSIIWGVLLLSFIELLPNVEADEIVGLWKKKNVLLLLNEDKTFYYLEKRSDAEIIAEGKWSLYNEALFMKFNDESMYNKVEKQWSVVQLGQRYHVVDEKTHIDCLDFDYLDFKRVNNKSSLEAALISHFQKENHSVEAKKKVKNTGKNDDVMNKYKDL